MALKERKDGEKMSSRSKLNHLLTLPYPQAEVFDGISIKTLGGKKVEKEESNSLSPQLQKTQVLKQKFIHSEMERGKTQTAVEWGKDEEVETDIGDLHKRKSLDRCWRTTTVFTWQLIGWEEGGEPQKCIRSGKKKEKKKNHYRCLPKTYSEKRGTSDNWGDRLERRVVKAYQKKGGSISQILEGEWL